MLCAFVEISYNIYQGPTWKGVIHLTCLLIPMHTSVSEETAQSHCSQPYQQCVLGKQMSTVQGRCSSVENISLGQIVVAHYHFLKG